MTLVVFTVDTERDSSHAIEGNPLEATTFGLKKPTFSATERGLRALLPLLDELEIPATFFFEAKTALVLKNKMNLKKAFANHEIGFHGFNHEDFAGVKRGIKVSEGKRKEIFQKGTRVLQNVFGRKPKGFRAPYLGVDGPLLDLAKKHCDDDYSLYGTRVSFYKRMPRIPVFEGTDARGKLMQAYFWPLMEGDRSAGEYVRLVKQGLRGKASPIVIATHSWHTHMTRKQKRLGEKQAREKLEEVRRVLGAVKKLPGVEFTTLDTAVKAHKGPG